MPMEKLSIQEYNQQLLDMVLTIGSNADFEERRQIVRRELHRAFDPQFFPALLQLLEVLSENDEKSQIITISIISAIVLELREFFDKNSTDAMSMMAICTDFMVALLTPAVPLLNLHQGIEIAKRVL